MVSRNHKIERNKLSRVLFTKRVFQHVLDSLSNVFQKLRKGCKCSEGKYVILFKKAIVEQFIACCIKEMLTFVHFFLM